MYVLYSFFVLDISCNYNYFIDSLPDLLKPRRLLLPALSICILQQFFGHDLEQDVWQLAGQTDVDRTLRGDDE